MQIEILQNPGIYFYSGLRKNVMGGGCAIRNTKYNLGIDFYSGFRKTSQGGGVQYEILKSAPPPPPLPQNLEPPPLVHLGYQDYRNYM